MRKLSQTRLERPATLVRPVDVRSTSAKQPVSMPAGERSPTDAFVESASVGRVDAPAAAPSAPRLGRIRVEGVPAEIILPIGDREPAAAFREYLDRLEGEAIFPEAAEVIARLKNARLTEARPVVAGEPMIGVLTSTPLQFDSPERSPMAATLGKAVREVEAGGHPVLVPPCADLMLSPEERAAGISGLVRSFDGLVGLGGPDIDPSLYGQENTYSQAIVPRRDLFERDVAREVLGAELFFFAICRDHQLFNVAARDGSRDAYGNELGTMVQDVEKEGYASLPQNQAKLGQNNELFFRVADEEGRTRFEHRVYFDTDSRLGHVVRRSNLLTNSYHHQALRQPGPGFQVVGAERDPVTGKDIIEATERWNGFTTQFHPEKVATERPVDRTLFGTVVRRGRIFQMVKAMRAENGGRLDAAALLARLEDSPKGSYHPSDLAWVREDLLPRLINEQASAR